MAKQVRSRSRLTRKARRGGSSSSLEAHTSEARIFSRPTSGRSRSASRSKSKSKSPEEYVIDTCPICFEHLSIAPIVTTKCNHTFHEECLIGWCSAQRANKTCPVCRRDIKDTCLNIGPFNSKQIFQYIEDRWSPHVAANNEMAALLIANPKFDPNVRASYQDSPGEFSLFWHLARVDNRELLKKLLARPDLVIPASDAADFAGDNVVRKLLIEYKKVPPKLKKLWM